MNAAGVILLILKNSLDYAVQSLYMIALGGLIDDYCIIHHSFDMIHQGTVCGTQNPQE